MYLSNHASVRCNQRGIPPFAIDLILDFGAVEHNRGREIFWLDKKGLRRAKHYLGKLSDGYAMMLKDLYVVVDGDAVITVARKNRHHKRDRH